MRKTTPYRFTLFNFSLQYTVGKEWRCFIQHCHEYDVVSNLLEVSELKYHSESGMIVLVLIVKLIFTIKACILGLEIIICN